MKLLVCIKQVLDSNIPLRIDEGSGRVIPEGPSRYWMNHADEFAVEEAVRIKESLPGTVLDVLTVGPDRTTQVLERAIGMGADTAVHVHAPEDASLTPLTIATWIGAFARNRGYDLILTGIMAEDDMQGQVGPLLAEYLEMPCATGVIFETVYPSKGVVYVEREIENARRYMLELDLPAVLTVQTGINHPRYPTLSNLIRARKDKPFRLDSAELASLGVREKILRVHTPGKSREGLLLQGDRREKAGQLLEILKREGLL